MSCNALILASLVTWPFLRLLNVQNVCRMQLLSLTELNATLNFQNVCGMQLLALTELK